MKKILFCLPHMLGRGVERSLLSLLEYLPREKFDITVAFVQLEGEFLSLIPKDINIIEINMPEEMREMVNHPISGKEKVINMVKRGRFGIIAVMLWRKYVNKDSLAGLLHSFKEIPIMQDEYDLALCYHMHCPFLIRYVTDKVKAKRKAIWIHNDFANTNFPVTMFKRELASYDKIFAVSKQCADEFIEHCPEYADKVSVFYNYLQLDYVREQSEKGYPAEIAEIRGEQPVILSVGRLEKMKGFDLAIQAADILKKQGYSFHWFVLGTGDEKDNLERLIDSYDVCDCFTLCGAKENPYSWYKNSDLMVISSRHEGFSLVLMEARALNLPVVATDFAGAKEQILQNETGIVVGHDVGEITNAVKKLLDNRGLLQYMRCRLQQEIDNINDKEQLTKLMELLE